MPQESDNHQSNLDKYAKISEKISGVLFGISGVLAITGVGIPAAIGCGVAAVVIGSAALIVSNRNVIVDGFNSCKNFLIPERDGDEAKEQLIKSQENDSQPPSYEESQKSNETDCHWVKDVVSQGHHHHEQNFHWTQDVASQGHHHRDPEKHWSDEVPNHHNPDDRAATSPTRQKNDEGHSH